jgi:hypothetical protein
MKNDGFNFYLGLSRTNKMDEEIVALAESRERLEETLDPIERNLCDIDVRRAFEESEERKKYEHEIELITIKMELAKLYGDECGREEDTKTLSERFEEYVQAAAQKPADAPGKRKADDIFDDENRANVVPAIKKKKKNIVQRAMESYREEKSRDPDYEKREIALAMTMDALGARKMKEDEIGRYLSCAKTASSSSSSSSSRGETKKHKKEKKSRRSIL